MRLLKFLLMLTITTISITGCSRKEHAASSSAAVKKTEAKSTVKKPVKMPVPKVITVDDRAAKRTPDGRHYYELNGRRYWKNYDDGKYYLFNKSMYTDSAFKPH